MKGCMEKGMMIGEIRVENEAFEWTIGED